MKKLLLFIFIFFIWTSFASWDSAIDQEEQQAQNKKMKILNENFKLEKFSSKKQFETVLIEKLYNKL